MKRLILFVLLFGACGSNTEQECLEYEASDCPTDRCLVREAQQWDAENECYAPKSAYCMPKEVGCSTALASGIAPDGACWYFSSMCPLPADWSYEDPAFQSCPLPDENTALCEGNS